MVVSDKFGFFLGVEVYSCLMQYYFVLTCFCLLVGVVLTNNLLIHVINLQQSWWQEVEHCCKEELKCYSVDGPVMAVKK